MKNLALKEFENKVRINENKINELEKLFPEFKSLQAMYDENDLEKQQHINHLIQTKINKRNSKDVARLMSSNIKRMMIS